MTTTTTNAIAETLRQHIIGGLSIDERTTAAAIAGALAGHLATADPGFNVDGFLARCGVGSAS